MKKTIVIIMLALIVILSNSEFIYAVMVEEIDIIENDTDIIDDINKDDKNSEDIIIDEKLESTDTSDTIDSVVSSEESEDIDIQEDNEKEIEAIEDRKDTTMIYSSVNSIANKKEMVEINKEWYMVINDKIDYHYTGLGQNQNGMWYFENGKITYRYTGIATDEYGKQYVIEKSQVFNGTKMLEIDKEWYMIIRGAVDYSYTGLGKNQNGTWLFENGIIDYNYTDTYFEGDLAYIVRNNQVLASFSKDANGLVEIKNEWYMVVNNKIDYNYTGLGQNQNGIWYMQNGKITYQYNGTVTDNTGTYLVEASRVLNVTKMLEIDNNWRMIINGKVDYNYTGISKNYYGTWYIENGNIDYNYTGTYFEGNTAYIVEKNRVCAMVLKTETKMIEIDKEWRMIINGAVDYNYTGLGKNQNGTWLFENGIIDYNYTDTYFEGDLAYIVRNNQVLASFSKDANGLVEIKNEWYMVVNNKIDYNYTGIGENKNGRWYLQNGKIPHQYNGIFSDETGTYLIEGSYVPYITKMIEIDREWYMLINGKVDETYTGIGQNQNGMWYFENGKITYNFTDTYFEGDLAYIAEGSRVYVTVPKDTTRMLEINRQWRAIVNGKVDYNYTGLSYNQNGKWYFENGKLTYTYNAQYTDEKGIVYNIINSNLRDIVSVPGYEATMVLEKPVEGAEYISDSLIISGWALSNEKNDSILIYADGKEIGKATRNERVDIFEKYPNNEYGGAESTPLPGFYYDLSAAKLRVGEHRIKVVNIAADGTVMQTRDVYIKITAMTKSFGIDVSHYQGVIDWNAVKKSGVTFAILKIGEYWSKSGRILFDEQFERNYAECKRLGIAIGGYFYSYAFNAVEAAEEAKVCLSLIPGKRFELPIFLDVEDKIIKNGLANGETNRYQLTQAALKFCDMMNDVGHQAGVYASRDFYRENFIIKELERHAVWVAQWASQLVYEGKYDFWQYTSDGSVSGINGRVDLDWYFPKK